MVEPSLSIHMKHMQQKTSQ